MHAPRTHIRLGVADTEASIAFYEALLGAPPSSRSRGLAVFDSDAPPLVLQLESFARAGRAAASRHKRERFTLKVPAPDDVGKAAVALWRAGARLRLQDRGIEARDPDGNAWQVDFVPSAKGRLVVANPEKERP